MNKQKRRDLYFGILENTILYFRSKQSDKKVIHMKKDTCKMMFDKIKKYDFYFLFFHKTDMRYCEKSIFLRIIKSEFSYLLHGYIQNRIALYFEQSRIDYKLIMLQLLLFNA